MNGDLAGDGAGVSDGVAVDEAANGGAAAALSRAGHRGEGEDGGDGGDGGGLPETAHGDGLRPSGVRPGRWKEALATLGSPSQEAACAGHPGSPRFHSGYFGSSRQRSLLRRGLHRQECKVEVKRVAVFSEHLVILRNPTGP